MIATQHHCAPQMPHQAAAHVHHLASMMAPALLQQSCAAQVSAFQAATPVKVEQHVRAPASPLSEALDDLAARFLNCPGEDMAEDDELMLLMFEVEKAHWFYTDFWRERVQSLPSFGMREFALKIFTHTAYLKCYAARFDSIYTKWQEYKRGVPTFGAIILNINLTKALMVQGYGGNSWGWPKGKLNKDESDAVCAAREVYEEIGFDVTPYINEKNAIVAKMGEQDMKLFVIPGIPEDTVFETHTRQEIKDIKWHVITDLQAKVKDSAKKNKYYSVLPVLGRLVGWIRDYKRSLSRSRTPERKPPGTNSTSASPACNKREKSEKRGEKVGKKGGSYSLVQQELDAAGVARDNADTFGATFEQTAARGFSADEMFKVNEERFNIHSTYSFDQYTTALPGKQDSSSAVKGVHAPERFRPCAVQDAQTKLDAERANKKKANEKTSQEASCGSALLGFTFDSKSIIDSMGF